MIEGGDRLGFAVEVFEEPGVLGQGDRQDLHGHAAAQVLVLGKIDDPHASRADPLQNLVLADAEAAPLALEELLGLKVGQESFIDQELGRFLRIRGQGAGVAPLAKERRQALGVRDLAFLHECQEFVGT